MKPDRYHLLLAAAFAAALAAVGYNAARAPDFRFPVREAVPYERRMEAVASALPAAKININTAVAAELESLPGIGEKTAAAIVKYRKEHGRFHSRKEIMEVPGIGEKTYEKIKDHICV